MVASSKIIKLITLLTELTQESKIEWHVDDPPQLLTRGTDFIIPIYYVTTYKNKEFAIYKRRYQNFFPEYEKFYWTEEIVLALMDDDTVIWDYSESSPALYNLFEAVREQVAGIDDIVDNLIDEIEN